jgi:hypothetical protein
VISRRTEPMRAGRPIQTSTTSTLTAVSVGNCRTSLLNMSAGTVCPSPNRIPITEPMVLETTPLNTRLLRIAHGLSRRGEVSTGGVARAIFRASDGASPDSVVPKRVHHAEPRGPPRWTESRGCCSRNQGEEGCRESKRIGGAHSK